MQVHEEEPTSFRCFRWTEQNLLYSQNVLGNSEPKHWDKVPAEFTVKSISAKHCSSDFESSSAEHSLVYCVNCSTVSPCPPCHTPLPSNLTTPAPPAARHSTTITDQQRQWRGSSSCLQRGVEAVVVGPPPPNSNADTIERRTTNYSNLQIKTARHSRVHTCHPSPLLPLCPPSPLLPPFLSLPTPGSVCEQRLWICEKHIMWNSQQTPR